MLSRGDKDEGRNKAEKGERKGEGEEEGVITYPPV